MTVDTQPLLYGEEVISGYSAVNKGIEDDLGEYEFGATGNNTNETFNPSSRGDDEIEDIPLSQIPNLFVIQLSLFANVFLAGFDGTVTASTYQLIGNEYNHVSMASWITTSYLLTSTAFQPLYGSFSDVLGRRKCLFFANTVFAVGCFACGMAPTIYVLVAARALCGVGGGGLVTLSTIVNSDLVPASRRGIFQAFQNLLLGFGSIIGAASGGWISTQIGWRWCFFLQVPISVFGTVIGFIYVKNQKAYEAKRITNQSKTLYSVISEIDIVGAILLVVGLTTQLLYITLVSSITADGLSWLKPSYLVLLGSSFAILGLFVYNEEHTTARPIIPRKLVQSTYSQLILVAAMFVGFASFAYLFTLPLFFQIVVGDSPSIAGLKLAIPSFCTPIGGLITGIGMSKWDCLPRLLQCGIFLMGIGNALFTLLSDSTPNWITAIFLLPSNIGQGMAFPASLFSFIFAFPTSDQATATSALYLFRAIGSVWGVAGSASLIQFFVSKRLRYLLKGKLTDKEINKLLAKLSENTQYIDKLKGKVRKAAVDSYACGAEKTHVVSTLLCVIALFLSFASVKHQPKSFKKFHKS
ncbi:unnamed protein product [Kluyveromyces dobzhanskii CBS 2104]|uniref:WGS project CCBQ000000000 data, contig 00104 n=1 Tax=Kluyveromyces dobzhanskii CBS 2104 TaxID=1427455 RepID=A0A0A8L5T3_9SACH|nr:unnamed protein product [Kluyveromyces dobzhanskii CBS 2104]